MGETLTWIDGDGVEQPLQVPGQVKVLRGLSGRFSPPVDFTDEQVPGQAGTRLRQVRFDPSEPSVPLLVRGADSSEVRTRIRDWARRFDPTRGDGRLRSKVDDLDARELSCRYVGGLEGDESEGWPGAQRFVAVFRAFDPFWQDAADTTATFTTGEGLPEFFPFPPLVLASSSVWAQPTVINDGDVDTWPIWTVRGPGEGLRLENATTGAFLELTTVLAAGESLTIDTRPGRKTMIGPAEANLFPERVPGSSLWPLAGGANDLLITLDGATDVSAVELAYRRRYLGA